MARATLWLCGFAAFCLLNQRLRIFRRGAKTQSRIRFKECGSIHELFPIRIYSQKI